MKTNKLRKVEVFIGQGATVLLTLAIVSLFGYTDFSAGLRDGDTLVDVDLGFPQLVDNLFRSTVLPDHLSPLFVLLD